MEGGSQNAKMSLTRMKGSKYVTKTVSFLEACFCFPLLIHFILKWELSM